MVRGYRGKKPLRDRSPAENRLARESLKRGYRKRYVLPNDYPEEGLMNALEEEFLRDFDLPEDRRVRTSDLREWEAGVKAVVPDGGRAEEAVENKLMLANWETKGTGGYFNRDITVEEYIELVTRMRSGGGVFVGSAPQCPTRVINLDTGEKRILNGERKWGECEELRAIIREWDAKLVMAMGEITERPEGGW